MSIKLETLHRGITEVARQVGVHHSHLARVLRGERKPSAELVKKLKSLGVEVPVWTAGAAK